MTEMLETQGVPSFLAFYWAYVCLIDLFFYCSQASEQIYHGNIEGVFYSSL